MPYCAILECKNDSRYKNLLNGGISYHRFPKEPIFKERWIKATGRVNWMPSKSSTICSEHFSDNNFLISKKGYRYLKTIAIPTLKTVIFFQKQNLIDVTPDSSTVSVSLKSKQGSSRKRARLYRSIVESSNSSALLWPMKQKLKYQMRWREDIIQKQKLKIKRLQAQNRKLTNKIINISNTFNALEEKLVKTEEKLICLENTDTKTCRGCSLNRLPEVKKFVMEDASDYDRLEVKFITGAVPEFILLDDKDHELERFPLSQLTRSECKELVESKGFKKKNTNSEF